MQSPAIDALPEETLVARASPPRVVPSVPASNRLVAIDLLRGVAVFVVVLCHLPLSWSDLGAHPSPAQTLPAYVEIALEYGRVGVHLFLILSGFCIHLAWAREGDVQEGIRFGAFWRKRMRRLYPPYLVALIGTLVFSLALHAGHAGDGLGARFGYADTLSFGVDLLLLLLLAQNLTIASHRVGNGPFWSLALEEQLYMLYFALLAVRRRVGWRAVWVMTLTVSLLWRGAWWLHDAELPETWLAIGPSRWFEWALGAYAVEAHRGHVTLPRWARQPLVFVLLLCVAIWATPAAGTWTVPAVMVVIRDPLWGLAFFVLVNAMCRVDFSRTAPLARWAARIAALGTVSYSVYLVHHPLMVVVTRAAVALHVDALPLVMGLRFVVAFVGGYLFYTAVESRFLPGAQRRARA